MTTETKKGITISTLNELREHELVRDKYAILRLKKGDYNKNLGRKIGLPFITFTPDKEQICNFASICYLFSLFNIKISGFSAIPSGYVASFERNGKFFGTFTTDPTYISKVAKDLCGEEDSEFYKKVSSIISNTDKSLIERCLEISGLNKDEAIAESVAKAIESFDDANGQNCKDNDTIIENIICTDPMVMRDLFVINSVVSLPLGQKVSREVLDIVIAKVVDRRSFNSIEERNAYLTKVTKSKKDYDDIFDNFIINSGYYVYRGMGKEQDGKVLNSSERIKELKRKLQEIKPNADSRAIASDIIDIINICATDYSADIVYAVFNCIANGEGEKIDSVIPNNEGNKEEKEKLRRDRNPINSEISHKGRNK